MSFFSEFQKVVRYIPVVRTIVDIIVGAVTGVHNALKNPNFDRENFVNDGTVEMSDYIKPYQSQVKKDE